jgi:hypothetical protein
MRLSFCQLSMPVSVGAQTRSTRLILMSRIAARICCGQPECHAAVLESKNPVQQQSGERSWFTRTPRRHRLDQDGGHSRDRPLGLARPQRLWPRYNYDNMLMVRQSVGVAHMQVRELALVPRPLLVLT